jgi:hypothetical protein
MDVVVGEVESSLLLVRTAYADDAHRGVRRSGPHDRDEPRRNRPNRDEPSLVPGIGLIKLIKPLSLPDEDGLRVFEP